MKGVKIYKVDFNSTDFYVKIKSLISKFKSGLTYSKDDIHESVLKGKVNQQIKQHCKNTIIKQALFELTYGYSYINIIIFF